MIDHYLTIFSANQALYKEKASKFYAYAYPILDVNEVAECLDRLRKEHFKARHFCYAYFIDADRLTFRANDDGEPSGTAGKPILGQLEKRNLTNTLVVVVRYFGGTKLGVSGLIKAYKHSAHLVLESCTIGEVIIKDSVFIRCGYEEIGNLLGILNDMQLEINNIDYGNEQIVIDIRIRKSKVQDIITQIKAKVLGYSVRDIKEDTELNNIDFLLHETEL